MKAKELMINDWVSMRLPNSAYIEIGKIYSIDAVKDNLLIVEPIRLTEKILRDSGYELLSNYLYDTYYSVNGEFSIDYTKKEFRIHLNGLTIKINYVHELQHILRVCKFEELADNLKVE